MDYSVKHKNRALLQAVCTGKFGFTSVGETDSAKTLCAGIFFALPTWVDEFTPPSLLCCQPFNLLCKVDNYIVISYRPTCQPGC